MPPNDHRGERGEQVTAMKRVRRVSGWIGVHNDRKRDLVYIIISQEKAVQCA